MPKITFQHSGKSVDADEGEWMYEVAAGCGCSSGCATSRTCSTPTSSTATSPPGRCGPHRGLPVRRPADDRVLLRQAHRLGISGRGAQIRAVLLAGGRRAKTQEHYGRSQGLSVTDPASVPSKAPMVTQSPFRHSRQSSTRPERARTSRGNVGTCGRYRHQPPSSFASGGGSIPAPVPLTRASTISRPLVDTRQSSCHSTFSTVCVQERVNAAQASATETPAPVRHRLTSTPRLGACGRCAGGQRRQPGQSRSRPSPVAP